MHAVTGQVRPPSYVTMSGTNARRRGSLSALMIDALIFLAGLLKFVQLPIVGTLYLTEVLLALLLVLFLPSRGRLLKARLPGTFILLLTAWLLAQIVTDVIRGTTFQDYSRGWGMIAFALINFCALYLTMAEKPKRVVLFVAGLAGGQIAGYFVAPGEYALAYPWKFGYGMGINWILVLLAVGLMTRLQARRTAGLVLLGIAAVNIAFDFRSAAGTAFLAACVLFAQQRHRTGHTRKRLPRWRYLMLGMIGLLGAGAILQIYEYSVQKGWAGENARAKYERQTGGDFGLLLSGRGEILASSIAVIDSPLVGHGSWAKDCKYTSLYTEIRERAGHNVGQEKDISLITAHSHLVGRWVQGGPVGAIVWLWVLRIAARGLMTLDAARHRYSPLIAFFAIALIWDVLFSPFNGFTRFMTPFYIVVIMISITSSPKPALPKQMVLDRSSSRAMPGTAS